MNASATTNPTEAVSLNEQILNLRAQIDALDRSQFIGLDSVIIGKLKQQFGSTVFWYAQWDKNRDFSSVVGASLALGKLATLIDVLPCVVHKDTDLVMLVDSINQAFTQCWENIQKASGRIVPF
jgi:hypothetical protein